MRHRAREEEDLMSSGSKSSDSSAGGGDRASKYSHGYQATSAVQRATSSHHVDHRNKGNEEPDASVSEDDLGGGSGMSFTKQQSNSGHVSDVPTRPPSSSSSGNVSSASSSETATEDLYKKSRNNHLRRELEDDPGLETVRFAQKICLLLIFIFVVMFKVSQMFGFAMTGSSEFPGTRSFAFPPWISTAFIGFMVCLLSWVFFHIGREILSGEVDLSAAGPPPGSTELSQMKVK
ncbi:unnamed protein product [Amoebophrya sp. A120]|nr:unnamed protein product [Amoebophrya sp. A120]|eukprot:GSA120T00011022001.1